MRFSWIYSVIISFIVTAGALAPAAKASANDTDLLSQAKENFEPLPTKPEFKKDNPGTEEKIKLGLTLYFDTRLSSSNVFSCSSCHDLALGGTDNSDFSIGHNWKKGGRNAPTVFNAALHIAQFWDGRAHDVEEQAGMPVTNPVEMNSSKELVIERLRSIPGYVSMFDKAFPGEKPSLTYENMAKAIGAFERTLITPSRFDDFLRGDTKALTKEEKDGLKLFMDTGCIICHNGTTVGGMTYQKFGLIKKPEFVKDKGRFEVTKDKKDMHVFKVPSLRNIELTYPYFNGGEVWDLYKAVKIMGESQLGVELDDKQTMSIVTFLKALTGEKPPITLPSIPPASVSTPRPDTN